MELSLFEEGHIPGSRQIDWPDLENVETSDQSVATWRKVVEKMLTTLGVERTDTVVVYDGGTFYAARLWWILYQLGHADVRILNGGLEAWKADGFSLDTGSADDTPAGEPYVGEPNEGAIATIAEVQDAVGLKDVILVDARMSEEFVDSHIPGAINVPFTNNAAPEGPKAWKSQDDLLAMSQEKGITSDNRVIPYCTTGVRSAATFFTLGLIGYGNASLFTGSMKEWTSEPSRPVTKGEKP
jgi:thiosulfate/3-mercaptopyruvate sulfurtransferase